ncbi:MAG: hypothetical protein GX331_07750 [Firmicutes bacterium]|nr:hypothetical protein [Bacillota bacterium]
MRNHALLILLLLFAVIVEGCSGPQIPGTSPPSEGSYGTLTGIVTDEVSGLKLWSGTAAVGSQSVQIKDGGFEITNIPYGTYTLTIQKPFYEALTMQVAVNHKNIALTDLQLQPIYNTSEMDLFARLVHAEAKGESYKGQVAVAATILNRVLHPDYPNTLYGVINEVVTVNGKKYYQYEPVLNGTINQPAGESAKAAVYDALAGWDPSLGATGFFAPAKVGGSSWVWTRPMTITIGNHRFFK